ncbi:MAG: prolipoprotein diacylglyceryl transferase [Peptostreptococcaceae bacterium]|nr:prolipoprotein diacylglyceryl transferase [Peptostreptococcaceae bacterium]
MDPIAFEIFGMGIRWYGILISIGLVLGVVIAMRESIREGLDENMVLDFVIFAVPVAVLCARTYYVLFNLSYYDGDIMKMINIRQGGLAIHGAVIGGVITAIVYTRYKKIKFWKLADICAPGLILGQAIGRWGNFINQEAYGRPTALPWAIHINGIGVHPTFLYESLWNLMIFIFLMAIRKKKKFDGQMFALYMMLYSFGRFFIEGLRTDSLMIGDFRVAQLLSLALIVAGIGIYYSKSKKHN